MVNLIIRALLYGWSRKQNYSFFLVIFCWVSLINENKIFRISWPKDLDIFCDIAENFAHLVWPL